MGDYGKQSWSFISEKSFSARSDVPLDVLDYAATRDIEDGEPVDLAQDMLLFRERMLSKEPPKPALAHREPRSRSTPRRKMTVTFKDERESIPVVCRPSSVPSPSIQLLEAPDYIQRLRERSNTSQNFFNHQLYGSLRHGESVDPFSREYLGLAFTAASSGFMVSFLESCFLPLLSVYLNFNEQQSHAAERFLVLPGVVSFFIGVLSDFYPLWHFHRKSYMLVGWIVAYLNLMALVVITMVDDRSDLLSDNVRTFGGGVVYLVLMMGTSLGVTITSVTALTFLVELSQREAIHERGSVMMKYIMTREVFKLASVAVTSVLMDHNETTGKTTSLLSMKVVVLIMALIVLFPIPAVLFRLTEEKREIKVDALDRSSLAHQLWNIMQQQAVWRIILFTCAVFFLLFFHFENATRALLFWAGLDQDTARVAKIPVQVVVVLTMWLFRAKLLNYSWIRVSVINLFVYVVVNVISSVPVIFNSARAPAYYITTQSLAGFSRGILAITTTLPLIEITETGIEGATVGLVSSYDVLIQSVVATFSEMISKSSDSLVRDFSPSVLAVDAVRTRRQAFGFILGRSAINLLALLPILYLLPRQKLDAQQMRAYGGYNRAAGLAIMTLFLLLVAYAITVNILALLHRY